MKSGVKPHNSELFYDRSLIFLSVLRGTVHNHAELRVLRYFVVISLYFPDTQPTWLPSFTACQPFAAAVVRSNSVHFDAADICFIVLSSRFSLPLNNSNLFVV